MIESYAAIATGNLPELSTQQVRKLSTWECLLQSVWQNVFHFMYLKNNQWIVMTKPLSQRLTKLLHTLKPVKPINKLYNLIWIIDLMIIMLIAIVTKRWQRVPRTLFPVEAPEVAMAPSLSLVILTSRWDLIYMGHWCHPCLHLHHCPHFFHHWHSLGQTESLNPSTDLYT